MKYKAKSTLNRKNILLQLEGFKYKEIQSRISFPVDRLFLFVNCTALQQWF